MVLQKRTSDAGCILEVTDLRVSYGSREVVHGVSFTVNSGEIVGLVGESGSGKSTIARSLVGLVEVSGGKIVNRSHATQMVFQNAVGSLNPHLTVRESLSEALAVTRRYGVGDRTANPESLLAEVGLSRATLDQYPHEMSGGQCQRVSIARALACSPELLVADEPVSALDVSVQARVLNLFRDLRSSRHLAILLIAHDLAVVRNICDRIAVMENGSFADFGKADSVFAHPTSNYTRRLLEAVPRISDAIGDNLPCFFT